MKKDDMILVSVDDHIIEPRDLFERHIAAEVGRARAAPGLRHEAPAWRRGRWEYGASAQPFINAVVTLPNARVGLRPGHARRDAARLLRRRRARARHGRQRRARRRCASRRSRAWRAASSPRRPTASSPSPACRPTTTGTSTSGARRTRAASSRCRLADLGRRSSRPREVRRVARKGATAITFTEDPEAFGLPSIHTRRTGIRSSPPARTKASWSRSTSAPRRRASPAARPSRCDVRYTMPTLELAALRREPALEPSRCGSIPDLKIALSEGGTSWIPGFLDRMERHYHVQKWVEAPISAA